MFFRDVGSNVCFLALFNVVVYVVVDTYIERRKERFSRRNEEATEGRRERKEDHASFGYKSVPKTKKESLVRDVFESVAPSYDVMNDLMSVGMHRLWKDYFVHKLASFPGMTHLDVAGGTGDVSFRV